jgi:hypothetical protein
MKFISIPILFSFFINSSLSKPIIYPLPAPIYEGPLPNPHPHHTNLRQLIPRPNPIILEIEVVDEEAEGDEFIGQEYEGMDVIHI